MNMSTRMERRERARKLTAEILDFKAALIEQRKKLRLTQKEVAERMDISQSSLSEIERYDSNPTLKTILKYAAAVEALLELKVKNDVCPRSDETFAQMVAKVQPPKQVLHQPTTYPQRFRKSEHSQFGLAT